MCGIHGAPNSEQLEKIGQRLQHRGKTQSIEELEDFAIGHALHPVVGEFEQPIKGEGLLSANCEIYNWKQVNEKRGWQTENDAETLLRLLDEKGLTSLKELDGIYAFAYLRDNQIIIARDILGVNPVWYNDSEENFAFASEKQALEKAGYEDVRELHPRKILKYDLEAEEIEFEQREFFEIDVDHEKELEEAAAEIKGRFLEAVEKRVPEGELGLLFSGGVDSTMIAAALQELGKDFTAYTAGIQHGNVNAPRDMAWAEEVAEEMDVPLEKYEADLEEVEEELPKLVDWISSTSVVKNGVALPFHYALVRKSEIFSSSRNSEGVSSQEAPEEQVVMSGLGSEQLYAGYSRMEKYLNKECLSGLRKLFERDLYRDNVVSFRNGRELRVPFLDHDLIEHALTIPDEFKKKDDYRKYVLRKAAEKLGVPEKVAWRGKKAAQYGSNFDKAINRLAKDNGFDHKQEFLNSLRNSENFCDSRNSEGVSSRDEHNKKLAALTSGGKDSNAALYRVQRRNNEISCLVTLRSENKDSYMFDSKKSEKDIEWQSEKLGIPLLVQETEGEKEKELKDLEEAMHKAREEYGVEGVVAGALASTYQRDRMDKVAEKAGLKVFAPLWREDQERYLKWLIREGFEVEITSVAARGLEEEWEGVILDGRNVEDLIELSREYGFNAAGEGGEYETKVVGFPDSLVD